MRRITLDARVELDAIAETMRLAHAGATRIGRIANPYAVVGNSASTIVASALIPDVNVSAPSG